MVLIWSAAGQDVCWLLPERKTGCIMLKVVLNALVALMLIFLNAFAVAQTAMIEKFVPEAELVGEARFKVLLFPVYDASLYAPNGEYERSSPLALVLNYVSDLKKERIVSTTVKTFERRKMGSSADIDKWRKIMRMHFSDVRKGDQIMIAFPDFQTVVFSTNGSNPTFVRDQGFAAAFKDLWLGDNVRNKRFQTKLIGLEK